MDQAAEILVIIVSSVLFVFLVVGIVLGIYIIKLTAEIRRLARSAQDTVTQLEHAVVGVSRMASPLYVAQMVNRYIKKFAKTKEKGEKEDVKR